MELHTLKRKNPNKKKRLVGRGGTRGKTSGRGTKGQNARSGRKKRPQIRDIIKKIPKLRGYRFSSPSIKAAPVNVSSLNVFANGAVINPASLVEKNLVRRIGGKVPAVKVLGTGEISISVTIENCTVSKTAREKIEKAGGKVL